jgi:DNA-binding CsgD family transcriptional regulator
MVVKRDSNKLTEKEEKILSMIVEGMEDGEIGHALSVSYSTVRTHTTHIYAKLGVRNRTEAAVFVMQGRVEEERYEKEKLLQKIKEALPELTALSFYQSRSIELMKDLASTNGQSIHSDSVL